MSVGRVLVIAPSPDFRRSITFALETEGYAVTALEALPGADATETYDCVVLDHRATKGNDEATVAFCRRTFPVVLLAGRPQPWLVKEVFSLVQAPIIGEALSGAVRAAIAANIPTL
jgi:DNA-binding NtrC family response regulator